ncbi:Uncharacterised protein [Amycolatopsis camponoti]|uniref:Uncharacterized protein n=1 Tax=Amycolatopsis camponoti TaxID=2606593 RepID=A0A6I8LYK4_9PSEU|nr:Uncharacterised protein [Amycolatopsis camponoti]
MLCVLMLRTPAEREEKIMQARTNQRRRGCVHKARPQVPD